MANFIMYGFNENAGPHASEAGHAKRLIQHHLRGEKGGKNEHRGP
jgi:hypothetical protein